MPVLPQILHFLVLLILSLPICTLNDLRKLLYKRLILEKIMKFWINDFQMMFKIFTPKVFKLLLGLKSKNLNFFLKSY